MSAPIDHTLEEHRDYLYQIVRLKLFFLHNWLKGHPDETELKEAVEFFKGIIGEQV